MAAPPKSFIRQSMSIAFAQLHPGGLLSRVARLVSYKRIDLAVDACTSLEGGS